MDIKAVTQENRMLITLAGSIDEVGALKLEEFFGRIDLKIVSQVTLDFHQVAYIGSAGVGILLLLYKRMALQNGRIAIEKIPKEIFGLLAHDMNLGQVFALSSL